MVGHRCCRARCPHCCLPSIHHLGSATAAEYGASPRSVLLQAEKGTMEKVHKSASEGEVPRGFLDPTKAAAAVSQRRACSAWVVRPCPICASQQFPRGHPPPQAANHVLCPVVRRLPQPGGSPSGARGNSTSGRSSWLQLPCVGKPLASPSPSIPLQKGVTTLPTLPPWLPHLDLGDAVNERGVPSRIPHTSTHGSHHGADGRAHACAHMHADMGGGGNVLTLAALSTRPCSCDTTSIQGGQVSNRKVRHYHF